MAWWGWRDLRRRWASLVFLALLIVFAAGVTLAAAAGARRNATAVDRIVSRSRAADLIALPNLPGFDWNKVRALPEVRAVASFAVTQYAVVGLPSDATAFPVTSDEWYRTVERGVLFAGRRPNPKRADEVMITPNAVHRYGLHVGSHVILSPIEYDGEGKVPPPPAKLAQRATVVGVGRSAVGVVFGNDPGQVLTTPAYTARFAKYLTPPGSYQNALVRLRRGDADLPRFQRNIDRIAGRSVELETLTAAEQNVSASTVLEADALYAFALAAGLASLVLVGQSLVRAAAVAPADLEPLRAIGMTRAQRALAGATGCIVTGMVAAFGTMVLAWSLSSRFPIGVGRGVEPSPGRQFNVAWIVPGGAAIFVLVAVASFVVGWRQQRFGERVAGRPSRFARAAEGVDAPIPVLLGSRSALETGRGRTAVPVRPAIAGAIVGVLGLVGALTFRAGLDHATASPAVFGQAHQALGEIFPPTLPEPAQQIAKLVADKDVAFVNDTPVVVVSLNRHGTTLFALSSRKGQYPVTILKGRIVHDANEIVLAPNDRDALHAHIGDVLRTANGYPFRVVGFGFTPTSLHSDYDTGAWVTGAAMRRVAPKNTAWKFHELHVGFVPGTNPKAAIGRYNAEIATLNRTTHTEFGIFAALRPPKFDNLRRVRTVPLALGGFLVLLAVGAVGHALVTAVQRRRQQIAVLRALGMTRPQSRWCVVAQATTLALIGIVVGTPLGVAVARVLWHQVANATPFFYRAPLAAVALFVVPVGALVLSNLLAAYPARRAARLRPAELLRTE